jgi:hypothetical protein
MTTSYKNIAVIGVGFVGLPIIKSLCAQEKASVIVLLRKGGSTPELPSNLKAKLTVDFNDQQAVTAALREHQIEVVVSAVGQNAIDLQKGLADASKAAGVKLFVPSEFGMPTEGAKEGILAQKNKIVEHLKKIGLPYARYYNGFFIEYIPYLLGCDTGSKCYIVGKGDKKCTFTSVKDVGGYVAHTLTTLPPTKLNNNTFRIEGANATFLDCVSLLGKKQSLTHVEKIPSELQGHEARTFFQQAAEEGAARNSWDPSKKKEGKEKADACNNLWEGHKWVGIKECLGQSVQS